MLLLVEPVAICVGLFVFAGFLWRWTGAARSESVLLGTIVKVLALSSILGLVNLRMRHRARQVEWAWVSAFVERGGDLATAFPDDERSARARIEEGLPAWLSMLRDLLERTVQKPASLARLLAAGTASLLASVALTEYARTSVASDTWGPWWLVLGLVLACAVFSAALWDLVRGCQRGRGRFLRPRRWAIGYRPRRLATVVPSAPLLVLVGGPLVLAYIAGRAASSLSVWLMATTVLLTLWHGLWERRDAARSDMWRRVEDRFEPATWLAARSVVPFWWVVKGLSVATGLSCLLLVDLAVTAPGAPADQSSADLWYLASVLFAIYLTLAGLILSAWPRPVQIRVVRTASLLDELGDRPIERIGTMLFWSKWLLLVSSLVALA